MATSYKIRLKRFNGVDYDVLNISSTGVIMNNGNTLEEEINNLIPSSNGIIKSNNGALSIATIGSDYTAVDDTLTTSATKTYSIDKIKTLALGGALYLTNVAVEATTGDIATVNNSAITANHVVAECVFANPSSIASDVTWKTASGSLVLNGDCTTATTANIVLVKT